jgi:hypothetical protein
MKNKKQWNKGIKIYRKESNGTTKFFAPKIIPAGGVHAA